MRCLNLLRDDFHLQLEPGLDIRPATLLTNKAWHKGAHKTCLVDTTVVVAIVRGTHVVAAALVSKRQLVAVLVRVVHHVATTVAANLAVIAVSKNIRTSIISALVVVLAAVARSQERF